MIGLCCTSMSDSFLENAADLHAGEWP
jgi:hypothetical protein